MAIEIYQITQRKKVVDSRVALTMTYIPETTK
jgi:hypothetical protein